MDGRGDGEELVSHTGACSCTRVAVRAEQGPAYGTVRIAGDAVLLMLLKRRGGESCNACTASDKVCSRSSGRPLIGRMEVQIPAATLAVRRGYVTSPAVVFHL